MGNFQKIPPVKDIFYKPERHNVELITNGKMYTTAKIITISKIHFHIFSIINKYIELRRV